MIERLNTKPYERNIRSNKVEYSTVSELYCMTHDFKVPFFMPDLSIRKIIFHRFRVDNNEDDPGIGYYMIIGCDLIVQLGLLDNFKQQVLQWDGATVPTEKSSGLLEKTYLTSREMRKVVIQNAELFPTR